VKPISASFAQRSPTIRDVARRAGVSAATVSRVLNDAPGVRTDRRLAVRRAARQLGFVPHGIARSLARGRTGTLGLIVADLTNPFYAETAKAITDAARGRGYSVILCNTDNLPRLQAEQIDRLRRQRVDGVLLGSVHLRDPAVERLVREGFPCVMFNRRLASARGNWVVLDNARGAEEATRHFLALGHRRIGFVAGPADFSTATERLEGYRRALAKAGVERDPQLVRQGHFRPDLAYQAALDLLRDHDRPTAILAGNDVTALAVLDAAADLGLSVPEDLALCGFDDTSLSRRREIGLTTVAQQKDEMGRLAVGYLLEFIEDPERFRRHPVHHVLPPTLVIRRSCGAVRATVAGQGVRAVQGGAS
jgi:LacI family transcriptional regulator